MKEKKTIMSSQYGFTKGMSCLTNLISLYDLMSSIVVEGKAVNIVCLDFRTSFDTVSHKILIEKSWIR